MAKARKTTVEKKKRGEDQEAILAELEKIREQNEGLLRAEDVVAFARNPNTKLHSKFTWNDGEAAEKYRLMQARQVIRVHVTIYPRAKQQIRAYVSLPEDRKRGGGYRSADEVLRIEKLRDQLIYQAHREMKSFIDRYEHLEELAGVIASMEGALVVDDGDGE